MNKIELAKWLHDTYEEVAKKQNWNTQENCKVEFDTLPDANKRTMIEVAYRLLNFDLLHLPLVMESVCFNVDCYFHNNDNKCKGLNYEKCKGKQTVL